MAFAIWVLAFAVGAPGATIILDLTQDALGDEPAETQVFVHHAAQVVPAKELKSELHAKQQRAESQDLTPASSIESIIYDAAAEFGLEGSYLVSVAVCESGLNPEAYNPAGYHGLFQFDNTTWSAYGYGSIFDPIAQSRTAARLIAAGQSSRWPNCA
jgi:hypothetical protein